MEVILLEDHPHLGGRGDVVNVARGYARNYLIPKKLAVLNTPSRQVPIQAEEQFHNREVSKEKESAEILKEELDGFTINIKAKTGIEGKLYGSITSKDIACALEEKGYVIDKRSIKLEDHIKEIGNYSIEISLFQDIKININLLVEEADD